MCQTYFSQIIFIQIVLTKLANLFDEISSQVKFLEASEKGKVFEN